MKVTPMRLRIVARWHALKMLPWASWMQWKILCARFENELLAAYRRNPRIKW